MPRKPAAPSAPAQARPRVAEPAGHRVALEERRTEAGEPRLWARVSDLRADPRNARLHPPRQVEELRSSFRRFGQAKPVVVDLAGRVLAGHGFLEALRQEGAAEAWVVLSTLDEVRAQAFAIADNRTAELGSWDEALLAEALESLGAVEPELVRATGFDDRELAELLSELDQATAAVGGPSSPRAPATAAPRAEGEPARDYSMQDRPPLLATGKAVARRGDVWALGNHRLACGDSRDGVLVREVLNGAPDFLVLTDPPYCSGSSQEAGKAAGTFGDIAADNLSAQGFRELIRESLAASGAQAAYLFTDWRQWANLVQIVEGSGLAARAMVVWDKGHPGIGAFWRPQHELVLFATRKSSRRAAGAVGMGNVLKVRRARNLHHYTEKPVELLELILRGDQATGRTSTPVFDPFAGSASTILAAARAGRTGLGVEVEPLIVDTALRRLALELKAEPRLVRTSGPNGTRVDGAGSFDDVRRERLGLEPEIPQPTAKKRTRAAGKAAP